MRFSSTRISSKFYGKPKKKRANKKLWRKPYARSKTIINFIIFLVHTLIVFFALCLLFWSFCSFLNYMNDLYKRWRVCTNDFFSVHLFYKFHFVVSLQNKTTTTKNEKNSTFYDNGIMKWQANVHDLAIASSFMTLFIVVSMRNFEWLFMSETFRNYHWRHSTGYCYRS